MKKTGQKTIFYFLVMALAFALSSCATTTATTNERVLYRVVECPKEISDKALQYAKMYTARDTVYDWGGQDLLEKEGTLKLDCSGLMVNCYEYAVEGTKYSLLFKDTTVGGFYENFTISIDEPRPGDFIFMGSDKSAPPSHMSIYVRTDDKNIYFIDATLKEEDGINGATERYYAKDDPRFFFYARLLIKY
jgi:hypothetical protein